MASCGVGVVAVLVVAASRELSKVASNNRDVDWSAPKRINL